MRSVLRICVQCQQERRTEPGRRVCNSCKAKNQRSANRVRMRNNRKKKRDLQQLTAAESSVLTFLRTKGTTPSYDEIRSACGIKSYAHVNRLIHSLRDKKKIGYVSRRIWVLPDTSESITKETSDG